MVSAAEVEEMWLLAKKRMNEQRVPIRKRVSRSLTSTCCVCVHPHDSIRRPHSKVCIHFFNDLSLKTNITFYGIVFFKILDNQKFLCYQKVRNKMFRPQQCQRATAASASSILEKA
jgi:hypothetical protein